MFLCGPSLPLAEGPPSKEPLRRGEKKRKKKKIPRVQATPLYTFGHYGANHRSAWERTWGKPKKENMRRENHQLSKGDPPPKNSYPVEKPRNPVSSKGGENSRPEDPKNQPGAEKTPSTRMKNPPKKVSKARLWANFQKLSGATSNQSQKGTPTFSLHPEGVCEKGMTREKSPPEGGHVVKPKRFQEKGRKKKRPSKTWTKTSPEV